MGKQAREVTKADIIPLEQYSKNRKLQRRTNEEIWFK